MTGGRALGPALLRLSASWAPTTDDPTQHNSTQRPDADTGRRRRMHRRTPNMKLCRSCSVLVPTGKHDQLTGHLLLVLPPDLGLRDTAGPATMSGLWRRGDGKEGDRRKDKFGDIRYMIKYDMRGGKFISLISSHLTWPYFVRSECAAKRPSLPWLRLIRTT